MAATPPFAGGSSTAFKLSVFAFFLVVCYYPMLLQTGRTVIFSDDMAYGFFAPVVALFVAWDRRRALLRPLTAPSSWSLAFLGIAAVIGTVATLANSSTFSRVAFLISLTGCLLLAGGWRTVRSFSF